MRIRVSKIGTVSSAIIAALLVASGCGGDKKTDPLGDGGSSANVGGDSSIGGATAASGGAAPTSGGTTTNGGTTNGGTSTTVAAAGKAPFACAKGKPTAPEIAPGTNGLWGTASPVAGGTFAYQDDTNVLTPAFTTDIATTSGSITLTNTIPAGGYAGYGIYFKDPEKCWDASAYTGGIRVTMSGNLSGADLLFQVQTNNNYPIDTANKKGACTGSWSSGCGNSQFKVPSIAATPTAVDIPWASLAGGSPIATIENSEILGIQWQINCPTGAAAACAPSLTIGAVTFY